MSIQFKLFCLPCIADSEEEGALNQFLRSVKTLTVHREFIAAGSNSFTLFTVEYFLSTIQSRETNRTKKGKIDYREVLCEEDFTVFAKLREWRKEAALKEAIAVYTIFTNEQLAQIAGNRPKSKAALQEIPGIGEAKSNKYGQAVLELVAVISKQQLDVSPPLK